jgi:iron complex transport system permease protein
VSSDVRSNVCSDVSHDVGGGVRGDAHTVVWRRAGTSGRVARRVLVVGAAAAGAAVAVSLAVLALGGGDYAMGPGAVVRALLGSGAPADELVVHELRLPRVATGLLVGAALGLSGAVFQTLARNPLASPDLLGVTHGAAGGALVAIVVGSAAPAVVAGGAVVGGLATGAALLLLATRDGLHGTRLVLVGVGLAVVLTGVNGYLLTRARIADAARAVRWLTGSLDGSAWSESLPVLVAVAVLVPLVVVGCGRGLRTLELGEGYAAALGVRVARVRLAALSAAVLLTSCAAATTGPVAFVALTAPQVARRLTRAPGPHLLTSVCVGAAVLVAADWAAQRVVPGRELPTGVVTGLLGGAYLLWLLTRERRAGRL